MRQSAHYPLAMLTALVLANAVCAQSPDLSSLDENSDDKISLAEFEAYAETRLDGFDQFKLFAKKVDANSDGEITQNEFDNRMEILQQINNGDFDKMEDEEESGKAEHDQAAPVKNTKATPADKDQSGAVEVFNKIKAHIKKNDWQTAASLMTTEAADRTAVQLVTSGLGMQNIELPMPIPKFEDAIDDIDAVIGKYGLDKLGIDAPAMLKIQIGIDQDDEESADVEKVEDEAQQKTNSQKIRSALDKDGKRWQIVGELWEAISSSPFGLNPLVGKAEEITVDGDTAVLEVKPLRANDEQPGIMIQIVAPPMFLDFEKSNNKWKYSGVNESKTEQAMNQHHENMGWQGEEEIDPDVAKAMKPQGTIEDPAFSGTTLAGKPFKLSDFEGKLVLVDFWGSWCPPCIAQLPKLKTFRDEFQKHGFEVVGVGIDDTETLNKVKKDHPELTWTVVVDAKGEISDRFGIKAFPTTLLIDKEGNHIGTDLNNSKLLSEIIKRLELKPEDFTDFKKKLRRLSRPKAVDGVDY